MLLLLLLLGKLRGWECEREAWWIGGLVEDRCSCNTNNNKDRMPLLLLLSSMMTMVMIIAVVVVVVLSVIKLAQASVRDSAYSRLSRGKNKKNRKRYTLVSAPKPGRWGRAGGRGNLQEVANDGVELLSNNNDMPQRGGN